MTDFDQRLLQSAIRASGLSSSAFARNVLEISPRTIRRMLAGEARVPDSLRPFLTSLVTEHANEEREWRLMDKDDADYSDMIERTTPED